MRLVRWPSAVRGVEQDHVAGDLNPSLIQARDAGRRATGLRELVREYDEKFALIIPPRDSEAIIEAMMEMRKNPELRAHYAAKGLERVRDPKFDWNRIAAQTVGVYAQTVEAWDARSAC